MPNPPRPGTTLGLERGLQPEASVTSVMEQAREPPAEEDPPEKPMSPSAGPEKALTHAGSMNSVSSTGGPGSPSAKSLFTNGDHGEEEDEETQAKAAEAKGVYDSKDLERLGWSPLRQKAYAVITDHRFETAMGIVVITNVIFMVLDADANAVCAVEGECTPEYVLWADIFLLMIYTCETLLRAFALQLKYFYQAWNILDLVIVVFGYIDMVFLYILEAESSSVLSLIRVLRVGRLLRMVKLLRSMPELYKLVQGFVVTIKAIWWGFVMIMILLAVFSLLSVQTIQPISRKMDWEEGSWCKEAFSSTGAALVLFFQTLVAGDSWGSCAVPIIMSNPAAFIVFALALFTIQIGFTNLILSVIVDSANTARDEDAAARIAAKKKAEQEDVKCFYKILERIDEDSSGTLTLTELLSGFDYDVELQHRLGDLDISRADLALLFELMDVCDCGSVSYAEFAGHMMKAQRQDMRMQVMFLKLQSEKMISMMKETLAPMRAAMERLTERVDSLQSNGPVPANGSRPKPAMLTSIADASPPATPSTSFSSEQRAPKVSANGPESPSTRKDFASGPESPPEPAEVNLRAALGGSASQALAALEFQLDSLRNQLDERIDSLVYEAAGHTTLLAQHTNLLTSALRAIERVSLSSGSSQDSDVAAAAAAAAAGIVMARGGNASPMSTGLEAGSSRSIPRGPPAVTDASRSIPRSPQALTNGSRPGRSSASGAT